MKVKVIVLYRDKPFKVKAIYKVSKQKRQKSAVSRSLSQFD